MTRRLLVLVAACHAAPVTPPPALAPAGACAVALPKLAAEHARNVTRLYLASFELVRDRVAIGRPVLATTKQGYVNQASFSPDGAGMYFTWRPERSQADIWYRDLATGAERPVTCTSEEEYGATMTSEGLVVLRIEPDLTRRLVRLDADAKVREVLFPNVADIGAYTWIDNDTVALFFGDAEGTRLALGNVHTGALETVANDVTAAVAVIPGAGAISFVDQSDETVSRLMRLDLKTRAITLVQPVADGIEKLAWLPDGSVLYGVGTSLVRNSRTVADLAGMVDGTITRVTVSGNRVALVVHAN